MFRPMQFLVNKLTLIVLINLTIGINGSCDKCHHRQHKQRLCQTTSTTPSVPAMECQAPIDHGSGKQPSINLLVYDFGRILDLPGACFCAPPTENSNLMLLKYFFSSADNSSKYINVNSCDKFCVLSEDGHIYSSPVWSDLYSTSDPKEDISLNTSSTIIPTTTSQSYDIGQLYVVGQGADAMIYPHCLDKNQDCHVYMSFTQQYRKCGEPNVCHAGDTESPPLIRSGILKAEDGSFWTSPNLADVGFNSHLLRIVAIGCDAGCDAIKKQTCDGSFVSMTECQAPLLHNGQQPIPLISEEFLSTSSSLLGLFACSNWENESKAKFYTNWLRPNYTDNPETDILVQCDPTGISDFNNFCALSDDGKFYQLVSNYNNSTHHKLRGQLYPRCDAINKGCRIYLGGHIDMYEVTPLLLSGQVPLSLKDVNGSIWTSPPKETLVDVNAGYLPIIAYSCLGCDAIRNLRCTPKIKIERSCDEAEIICQLKSCMPRN